MEILLRRPCFRLIFLVLSAFTLVRLLQGVDLPVVRWDEQTNIAVVSETYASRTPFVLIYHQQPFFEKPPLWYYVNIFVASIAGISPISMRIINIASGIGSIAICVYAAHTVSGWKGAYSTWAILLLSYPLFVRGVGGYFTTHTLSSADLDALMILFSLLAYLAIIKNKEQWSGVFTGLAALTKGPLGFVPLFAHTIIGRKKGTCFAYGKAWLVAIGITLPWYVGMILAFGTDFLSEHVGYHLVYRSITPIEGHANPWWFYFSFLSNPEVYPVSMFVLLSMLWCIRHRLRVPYTILLSGNIGFLYILIPTFTATRLSWYVLPALPYFAIMTGYAIAKARLHRLLQ